MGARPMVNPRHVHGLLALLGWVAVGVLPQPTRGQASRSDELVTVLRTAVTTFQSLVHDSTLLDPCSVHVLFGGTEDEPPRVPGALEGYTLFWDQPCPLTASRFYAPERLILDSVVQVGDTATVRFRRVWPSGKDPHAIELRRSPAGGWYARTLTIEPSFRGHPSPEDGLPDPRQVSLAAVQAQVPGLSLALDPRILALPKDGGLGLTSGAAIVPESIQQGRRVWTDLALPTESFPAALECLRKREIITGTWLDLADPDPSDGRGCPETSPDLVLLVSSAQVYESSAEPFGVRVRVYGAGAAGFRVWEVQLDRTLEVQKVTALLSAGEPLGEGR